MDVTAKAAPRLLGQYQTEGWAMGVSVSGNQAYVAAALGGLLLVDVSNPAFPAEVGGLAVVGGDAAGVAVAGTIAYVADRNWGLEAVDLSGRRTPFRWASMVLSGSRTKSRPPATTLTLRRDLTACGS